ncbi:MAG: ABC-2 family transporter protein [bacterium]|nr:ABC-2 family transporter protein [bacterium]MDZ4284429.1 ABC-2 family transporter protein [Patescibacteria group bacterium]
MAVPNKYLALIKANWQRGLTYRFTIVAYRVGEIAEMLLVLVLWSAIFSASGEPLLRDFTYQEMVTYFLIGNLFNMVVRSFAEDRIANDIKRGRLSVYLLQPVSYLGANFVRGFASLATLMSVASQLIVMLFFLNTIAINTNLAYLVVITTMAIFAFVIEFMIAYLIGLIAFWTDETDGVSASISRIKRFFAGSYFPLNLLPATFVNISFLLPFGYSFFIPAQLYLKKIDLSLGLKGLVVEVVWIIALYGVIALVWRCGLKRYESIGI